MSSDGGLSYVASNVWSFHSRLSGITHGLLISVRSTRCQCDRLYPGKGIPVVADANSITPGPVYEVRRSGYTLAWMAVIQMVPPSRDAVQLIALPGQAKPMSPFTASQ
jgi:hypothetical protein